VPSSLDPTAVQVVDETHETPGRLLADASAGSGVAWIVQVLTLPSPGKPGR
jgi:hypothetical protein